MKNRVRIIGGQWRGRVLRFADAPGLRPTGDRNRETLFNWLQPHVPGSRCLDLFAGSGALGFEAASRGAAHVVLVEQSRAVAAALMDNARLLQATERIEVIRADAIRWLHRTAPAAPFDLVFLDPPFRGELLGKAWALLERPGWLAAGALVYAEAPAQRPLPTPPSGWALLREQSAGQVRYALAVRDARPEHLPS